MELPTSLTHFLILTLISSSMILQLQAQTQAPSPTNPATTINYIHTMCAKTKYQKLCDKLLPIYATATIADPSALVRLAMNVTLLEAKATITYLNRIPTVPGSKIDAAFGQCIGEVDYAVTETERALDKMMQIEATGEKSIEEFTSIQSFVSFARESLDLCADIVDSVADLPSKDVVRQKITRLDRLTSIVTSLFDEAAKA